MQIFFKKIIAIAIVAIIAAVIAIPAFAGMYSLSATAGWEATDLPRLFNARATLSYTGGNGNEVFAYAYAETNLENISVIAKWDTAVAASFVGPWKAYTLDIIPFVTNYYGYAIYTGN
jgi:hypothetical protein